MAVRPRFQRAFLSWLEEARPRLALQPCVTRRTDRRIGLVFEGIDPTVECRIHRWPRDPSTYDATVHLDSGAEGREGRRTLFRGLALYGGSVDLNVVPGGYAPTPRPDAGEIHPTREALWRTYLFEPLLRWVNGKLAPAAAISVGWRLRTIRIQDTAESEDTWVSAARLVHDGDTLDGPEWQHECLVPLRVGTDRRQHRSSE